MGFFDDITDAAQNLPGVSTITNSIHSVESLVMPQELKNLQMAEANLQEKITALGQDQAAAGDISELRTYLMSYYSRLRDGGDPSPDALTKVRIQAMPQFKEVWNNFDGLASQLALLEKQYHQCTFGYKMVDGSIQVPTTVWSDEQWASVQGQAANCWLDADPERYV